MTLGQIILIFYLLGLIACKKDPCIMEYEQFTADEKSWLVYNVGDTIIYQNQLADKDTFVVYYQSISNYESIDPGFLPGRECYHPVSGRYIMINNDSTLQADLFITKDTTLELHFHKHPSIGDFLTNLRYTSPVDKIIINSKEYKDVYIVKRDQFYGKELVKSIIFNKDYGFIQYEMMDGNTWSIYEIKKK